MRKVLMILVFIIVLMGKQVYAQTNYKLTLEKQEGIYYTRYSSDFYKSSMFSIYKMGNNIVYCIEPTKQITTYNYIDKDNYLSLNLSEEEKENIALYGYFGREYPGHDNIRYSMASQALIWEATSNQKVTFWTEQYEKGDEIDISKEKNEILELVNNHKKKPAITSIITGGLINKEIIINDNNNVLNNYEVVLDSGNEVFIKDNALHIIPKYAGTTEIKLAFKKYDDLPLVVYVGKDKNTTQKLARLRITKNDEITIKLKALGSRVRVYKVDDNGERIKKSGIKLMIRNTDRNLYICDTVDCVYETDSEGMIFTNNPIYGNFELIEVENQLVDGYLWNSEPLKFSVNKDSDITWYPEYGNVMDVYLINKNFYGKINIHKIGEKININDNNISYEKINLPNIKFTLYDSNNNIIKEGITNQDGNLTFDKIKKGTYYLEEENNLDNYLKQERMQIDIIQEDQYHNIEINKDIENYLGKGNLIIKKIDSKTSEGISNTIIGIYDKNNNLLLEKETDHNGNIKINNLVIGEYYLKEIKPNDYYEISNKKIYFNIKNNEDTLVTMKNNKILGSIKIIKNKEEMKIIDNNIKYTILPFENIEFELYQNNKLLNKYKTNSDGIISINNLEIGNYYLKEVNNNEDYLDNNNIYEFNITRNNYHDIQEFKIINYLKKGILNFDKIDLETKEGIPNTIIEIYDENDNLLLQRETDLTGNIKIDNLKVGNYYIIEKTPNSLYQLTNQKIYFTIFEDNITKTKMTNEKIEIKVPKTGRNDMEGMIFISIIMILSGLWKMIINEKTN